MKLKVNKGFFEESLNVVERAISNRNTLPVLNNVLLEVENNVLTLITTNLEIAIKTTIDVNSETDGKTTIPVKLLSDYVSLLDSDEIAINLEEGETLHLESSKSDTKIKGISSNEFPLLPSIDVEKTIEIPVSVFIEKVSKIVFASALDELRPVLAGVFIKIENGVLYTVATDSYRLVETNTEINSKDEFSIIIPSKTILELSRVLHKFSDKTLKIETSKNQIRFTCKNIEMVSRIVEGQYPDYKKIIPSELETTSTINRQEFITAIKRASLFAKENANSIKLEIRSEYIDIVVDSNQSGSERAQIKVETKGEDKEIAFNAQYLIDALNNIEEEEVEIGVNSAITPEVIKPKGKEGVLHIIMPLKV